MAEIVPELVSTVIPVYNRPALIVDSVASVLAQTYRPIEIIVVDDGSTDQTPAVLQSLAAQHPEIRVLCQPNRGVGAAREHGRLCARGEFIQYLDSDDRLLPNKFAVQVAALRKAPAAGIAYGVTRLIDADGNVLESPYKWTGRSFEQLLPALLVDRWWNTHTPLYRREVCDGIGAWRPLPMSEDWEYEARVAASGTRLIWCGPQPLSDTRQHSVGRLSQQAMTAPVLSALSEVQASLLQAARRQGLTPSGPELRHLGRWAFHVARQSAILGNEVAARRSLGVAAQAGAAFRRDRWEVLAMRLIVRVVGWSRAGRLLNRLRPSRGPSKRTLLLSRASSDGRTAQP